MTIPTAQAVGLPLDEATDMYLLSLRRDRSPNTLRAYGGGLRQLRDFLDAKGMPTTVEHITRDQLEAWLDHLHQQGAAPATMANRLAILKSFFGFLVLEDVVTRSPTERMRAVRQPQRLAHIPSDEDIAALRRACSGSTFADRRGRAMLELLIDSGLRRQELADLTMDDVDLRNKVVRVRSGKGNKERMSKFTSETALVLHRYRNARREYIAANKRTDLPWFWVGHRGRLTDAGIEEAMNARARHAGVQGFHLHALRHYWRDRMQRAGLSREAQMALAGWESDRMIRHYARATEAARALEEYDRIIDR